MAKKRVRSSQQRARNTAETHDPVADVPSDETVATMGTQSPQTEPPASEASEAVQVEDPTSERRSKRPRSATPSETPASQRATRAVEDLCHACGSAAPPSVPVHKCSSCQVVVHAHCYAIPTNELVDPAAWTCESCLDQFGDTNRACVFCLQAGDTCMRRINTAHWPAAYRPADTDEKKTAWAHAMCAFWNPFHQIPIARVTATGEPTSQDLQTMDGETVTETAQPPSKPIDRPSDPFHWRLELSVPSCSFCEGDHGVRIQCRRLNCGRFFHVRCAHASEHGYVQVVHTPFLVRHAYCDRHQHLPHPSIGDLATKLLSKTMASLVPRDVATKVQAIARRIDSYASVDAVLLELVHLLEEMCNKGLKASKTDPPTFSMRQLQALQLVLDHLPQLRNVYDPVTLSKTSAANLVHDADVMHALQKAFSPQRFVRKFAGPLSAFHQCDACHEPFQERQHVFYCVSSEQPHALHWKCTKRKSAPKDSSSSRQGGGGSASTKKKSKSLSLVQQGHWTDVKLPKGLPSLGEGVTCGVCRAAVDARGILAGRKEASRMDFEKPTSEFMYGGCFVNEMDPRAASAAGLRTNRATIATAAGQSGTMVGGLRLPGKSALRRSASGASATLDSDGEGSAALEPPKMDRINVRRTTRWVACLAQVIRLVLAAKKEAKELEAAKLARENDEGMTEPAESGEAETEPSPPEFEKCAASTDAGVFECNEVGDVSSVTSGDAEMSGDAPTDSASPPAEATNVVAVGDAGSGDLSEIGERVVAPEEGTEEKLMSSLVETPMVAKQEPASASAALPPPSSLPANALAYLEEAKRVVRPYDAYALSKIEAAHRMLDERSGPGLSVLNTLIQEYTRFLYIKHTRAVAKATNEKRKRQELEAQEERERERKRIDREAEQALKKQMLAMRKKQRA